MSVPKTRARPTLPPELQPSESSLRVFAVYPGHHSTVPSEKPHRRYSQHVDVDLQGLGMAREGSGELQSPQLNRQRDAPKLGICNPSPTTTSSSGRPSVKRIAPVNNGTWRERLQARRPLPEQPPADVAFGESWLESIRKRVFVGSGVHVPQNSTDFGAEHNAPAGREAANPTPTYASHFVASPVPHSSELHHQ